MSDETRDVLRSDLAWLLTLAERGTAAAAELARCQELRERYGVERDGPDVLRAIRAAEDVLRGRKQQ